MPVFTQSMPSKSFSLKLNPVILALVPFRISIIGSLDASYNFKKDYFKSSSGLYILKDF